MKSQELLSNVWGVWLSFSSGNKSQADYGTNLIKLYQLNSWADFAYTWTQSGIKDPNSFFANPLTGHYQKFEIQGQMRKIESINFFKHPIEPTWQYGDNSKGGYYNFSLSKQSSGELMQSIYEILIFMAVGESLQFADSIKGVRIVDTSSKKKFRCRFEIWVDYQESDQNLTMIKKHAIDIKNIVQKSQIILTDIKFYNIGGKTELTQKQQPSKK